jgi:hypothetical protein
VSHIHFIGGEKGGVGKSVSARLLAQWFIDRELPWAGIDADLSHGALGRFYGDFTQPVDLRSSDSIDQIMDRALGAERQVLVDLPAQSARALQAWLEEANVVAFANEVGVKLSFWHVSDGGFASVSAIESSLRVLRDQVRHVVVRNYGRSKDFTQFDDSAARAALSELSGTVLDLPELDSTTMYRIDRLGSSFWAAIHRQEGTEALKPLERQRAKLWLDRCYAEFDKLAGSL